MKCQNCGENEANVKYTQIINGAKGQWHLCHDCAQKLGLEDMNFGMPMTFSSMLEDMMDMSIMPSFRNTNFFETDFPGFRVSRDALNGGVDNRYCDSEEVDFNKIWSKNTIKESKQGKAKKAKDSKEEQIKLLQERLQKEIKEERYEDAAKTRDEIKKLQ